MATEKQIEANRLNSLLSTGPKSDEGKAAARRNALKHGLAGAGIVMPIDHASLVEERTAELCSSLRPMNTNDLFLTEEIALEQLRAERCRRLERNRRQWLVEAALEHWDEDRRIAAERLGAQLSKEPALTACLLQRTLQGCDWLMTRWKGLGGVLLKGENWDDAQRRLAFDMLGTAPELRRGQTPFDPTNADDPDSGREACLRAVADEWERLIVLRAELEPRDEAEQRAAVHGAGAEADPELQLIHRYESDCLRRKASAMKQLKGGRLPYQPNVRVQTPDELRGAPTPSPTPPPPPAEAFLPPISGGAPTTESEADAPRVESPQSPPPFLVYRPVAPSESAAVRRFLNS